jgi:signal transduction histidine kinase
VARLLSGVTSVQSLTSIYVLGILLVSAVWGLGFGIFTAVASAVAFDLFLTAPARSVHPAASGFLATLAIFVLISLLAGTIPVLARTPREQPAPVAPGSVSGDETDTAIVPASLTTRAPQHRRDHTIPALEAMRRADPDRANGADREDYDKLCRIAEEQAALRNLATFVAHNAPPSDVFDAVARELAQVLGTKHTVIARYEPNDTSIVVTGTWNYEQITPSGTRWKLEKGTVAELVLRTRQPSRVNNYSSAGQLTTRLCQRGVYSSVGCPIIVGCDLWGVAIASSTTAKGLPADTEERMLHFTELAGAAIANAQSTSDLIASQARIVTAADESRRRIERDLHDGAQQNLVSIELQIRAIEAALPPQMNQFQSQLSDIAHAVDNTIAELQEISRGLCPRVLAKGGLEPALRALAHRSAIPVRLMMSVERPLPGRLEITVYYIVAEALTNAAKHAHATAIFVDLSVHQTLTRLTIRDDGIGGADATRGSGLTGLSDRVKAFGGRLDIVSPMQGGTTLRVQIPHEDAE